MSVLVREEPLVLGGGHGGLAARRAVLRWGWRLFRREWRQQSLLVALLLVAVAATTAGLGVATNLENPAAKFGTADHVVTLSGRGAELQSDIAALRTAFGTIDAIEHQDVPVPGSANPVDLRAQDPAGPFGRPMLRLDSGRWPSGPGEVAVTGPVARLFGLSVGGGWDAGGRHRTVVGLVENPLDLTDRFGLVAPGQLTTPGTVTVLIRATEAEFRARDLPDGASVGVRGTDGAAAGIAVLALATVGLLFAGLLAAAGFTVLAQRRLRALGMLGAIGAGDRHIRLALVADGAAVGAAGALTGAAVGVAGWFLLSPRLETAMGHRIDRFGLPWVPVVLAVLLAIATAVLAAWWPARAATRVPVVSALSARPVPPRPARRFAALGGVLLLGGLASLVAAGQTRVPYVIGGIVATTLGLLLLAPAGIAALGRIARLAPLAPRLALRDLARYRARSSTALAAIGLAVGIAATVALTAGVSVAKAAAPTGGNLPADQVVVWLSPRGGEAPVPALTTGQVTAAKQQADAIAADLKATSVLPLRMAVDEAEPVTPEGPIPMRLGIAHVTTIDGRRHTEFHGDESIPLFVATPELLAHYGIDPADADIITFRSTLDGYQLFPGRRADWHPVVRHADLPAFTSLPGTLLTPRAVRALHLTAVPAAWLLRAPHPVTQAETDRAQQSALAAGLSVEVRPTGADQARLAAIVTAVGIAVALGVLAMTVGLIRAESTRDLQLLTAVGARRGTRRALTAATAGALALLGAAIGVAGAYLAMLAWYHSEPHWLAQVPLVDVLALLAGLPAVAYLGGWLLAAREPQLTAT